MPTMRPAPSSAVAAMTTYFWMFSTRAPAMQASAAAAHQPDQDPEVEPEGLQHARAEGVAQRARDEGHGEDVEDVRGHGEGHGEEQPHHPAGHGRQVPLAEEGLHRLRAEAEAEKEAEDRQQDHEEAVAAEREPRAQEEHGCPRSPARRTSRWSSSPPRARARRPSI